MPSEYLLPGPHLYYDFNPQMISQVIRHLNPDNMMLSQTITSQKRHCHFSQVQGTNETSRILVWN